MLSSELMSGVDLGDVVFERASQLQFRCPLDPWLSRRREDAVYSVLDRPEGSVLVFHPSLRREHSDLVMRSDFTHLVQNAVRWLATAKNDIIRRRSSAVCRRVGRVWSGDTFRRVGGVATADVVQLSAGQTLHGWTDPDSPQVFQGPLVALDRVGFWESKGGAAGCRALVPGEDKVLYPRILMDASESTLVRAETVQADELPLADTGFRTSRCGCCWPALAIVWLASSGVSIIGGLWCDQMSFRDETRCWICWR
jgi:hypothetical protein